MKKKKEKKENCEIDCNRYDIYEFNFAQNPDDDLRNSAKSNGTGFSVDLNSCTIHIVK